MSEMPKTTLQFSSDLKLSSYCQLQSARVDVGLWHGGGFEDFPTGSL